MISSYRLKVLNAIDTNPSREVLEALRVFDQDDEVGAIVFAGNARGFDVGADIEERQEKNFNGSRAAVVAGVLQFTTNPRLR